MFIRLILSFSFCCCISSRELPSFVHVCRRKDPEIGKCFINTVNEMMPYLIKGIPEMDLPPIDPLHFQSVKIDTGNHGSVSINIELGNGHVSALQNLEIKKLDIDFDNLTYFTLLHIPKIRIESSYKIQGKILLFEINGFGNFSVDASDLTTNGIWKGNIYKKKNKNYINIDTIEFSNVELNIMNVKFENLFQGNDVLTDTVNNAINQNIDTLREELEPIIRETLAEILRDYFNRVYRLFSMDQLYPNN